MKSMVKTWLVGVSLVLALAGFALAQGQKAKPQSQPHMWDGTHWKAFPKAVKVAYIKGIGNMADFEVAVSGKDKAGCISAGFFDELKGKTIAGIVKEVDKYYKDKPGYMSTPVVEVVLRQCTALCKPAAQAPKKKK